MRYLFLVLICLGVLFAGCDDNDPGNGVYKLNPTLDANSPTGLYIPKDLEDCMKELEKALSRKLKHEIKHGDSTIRYHRNLGMWIRNYWGLWGNSRLAVYFNSMGVQHPDDMSQIILDSFYRHLNNRPTRLKEQVNFYKMFEDLPLIPTPGSAEEEN